MPDDEKPSVERRKKKRDPVNDPLPHSIQAEKALLGALMIRPEAFTLLPPAMSELAFFRDAHRRIFRAIKACHERELAVDLLTVTEELRRTNDLDDAGGPAYVSSLTDGMPRSANAPHYASVVVDHAMRRAVIALANRLLGKAYEQETPEELMDFAQREVLGLSAENVKGGPVSVADLTGPTFAAFEAAAGGNGLVTGVPTGFAELDTMTGGLQRGDMILVAARPSMGKTSLAMNVAEHAALAGRVTLVFSLEMTKQSLMFRMVSSRARINSFQMRNGFLNAAEHGRISNALSELHGARLYIDDTSGLPVSDLAARARRTKLEHGALDLIVIDYLQLLRVRGRFDGRNAEVTAISQTIKEVAKELDVPVLALSQLSRSPEEGKGRAPQLSDLRDSGSLEQDADLVLFIHRNKRLDEDDNEVELIIGKQRNGPSGRTIRLAFLKELTRFENRAAEETDVTRRAAGEEE